jgi:rubrerythrin
MSLKRSGDLEVKDIQSQLNLYRVALEKEKESVELYKTMLSEAKDDKDKELLEYLIKEEGEHQTILDELVLLINRPNDWVESAEFGKREEY